LPQNLLEATWTDLDSDELRVLLQHRFGNSLGQYDGDDGKLYLPAAGGQSRIALTFEGTKIATVEPGAAFDANEWEGVHREIELRMAALATLAPSRAANRLPDATEPLTLRVARCRTADSRQADKYGPVGAGDWC
jgi:hypothetical protein